VLLSAPIFKIIPHHLHSTPSIQSSISSTTSKSSRGTCTISQPKVLMNIFIESLQEPEGVLSSHCLRWVARGIRKFGCTNWTAFCRTSLYCSEVTCYSCSFIKAHCKQWS